MSVELRAPTRENAAAVADALDRFNRAVGIEEETGGEIEVWLDAPSADIENDVGYAGGLRGAPGDVLWSARFRARPVRRLGALVVPRSIRPGLWFLAVDGDGIAGIALCRSEWGGDTDFGWVSILGVRKPWRRRGVALALLRYSFCELRARGKSRVGLGVDAENPTGAVRLYERAGMSVERKHLWYEKPAG